MNNENALSVLSKPTRMLGRVFAVSTVMLLMACNASNGGSSQSQSSSEDSSSSVSSSSSSSVSSSSSSSSSVPDENGNPLMGAMLWSSQNLNGIQVVTCQTCHGDGSSMTGRDFDYLVTKIRDTMPRYQAEACGEDCAKDIAAWLTQQ